MPKIVKLGVNATTVSQKVSVPTVFFDHAQRAVRIRGEIARKLQQFRIITGGHFKGFEGCEPFLQFRQLRPLPLG